MFNNYQHNHETMHYVHCISYYWYRASLYCLNLLLQYVNNAVDCHCLHSTHDTITILYKHDTVTPQYGNPVEIHTVIVNKSDIGW